MISAGTRLPGDRHPRRELRPCRVRRTGRNRDDQDRDFYNRQENRARLAGLVVAYPDAVKPEGRVRSSPLHPHDDRGCRIAVKGVGLAANDLPEAAVPLISAIGMGGRYERCCSAGEDGEGENKLTHAE